MIRWKFQLGDRVQRHTDVYDCNSKLRYGYVIRRYSEPVKRLLPDLILGPYPELYAVRFDDGRIGKGFFNYGLDRVASL